MDGLDRYQVVKVCSSRAVGRFENPEVPVSFGGHKLPPPTLVELGLTVLPKSGGANQRGDDRPEQYLHSVPSNLNNNMKCCFYVSHFTTTFLAQDFSSQSVKEKQSLPLSLLTHAQLSSLFPSLSKCLPTSCLRILVPRIIAFFKKDH